MSNLELFSELLTPENVRAHSDEIWAVLEAVDQDFVPPLSRRVPSGLGPIQERNNGWPLPIDYLEFLMAEHVLKVSANNKVVGLLAFELDYEDKTMNFGSNVYVSTVGVMPGWRRRGVARELYRALWSAPVFLEFDNVVLRSWSTNTSHAGLLGSLGFSEVRRLPDDRGHGIDTVVFRRSIHPSPFT